MVTNISSNITKSSPLSGPYHDHLSCYSEIELVLTASTKTHFLVIGTLYVAGSLLAVTFNALFLTAMKRNRTLHKLSNYLLVCLSVFDLAAGLAVLPAAAVVLYGRGFFTRFCAIERYTQSLGYALASMSFVTIFTITLEEYIAITNPFFHQSNVNFKRIFVFMSVSWIVMAVACVICWPNSALWIYFQSATGLIILVTYGTVVFCYTRIFAIARKTQRKIRASCIMALPPHSRSVSHSRKPSLRRKSLFSSRQSSMPNNNRNKAVITSFTIILAFSVSYLPMSVFSLKRMIWRVSPLEQTVAYEWVQLIALYSSVVSPLVYYWRLREVRRELCKIFKRDNSVGIAKR